MLITAVGLAISYLAARVANGLGRYLGDHRPHAQYRYPTDRCGVVAEGPVAAAEQPADEDVAPPVERGGRRGRTFERQLSSALEMAESEPEVVEVIKAALSVIVPTPQPNCC